MKIKKSEPSCKGSGFFMSFWKVKRFLNIGLEAKMEKSLKSIDDFVYKLIDTKIEQLSQRQAGFVSHTWH